ncbi:MAG: glycosyltransferase family 2 protein [Candidatus Omnitrophica bacterium]|nr:glycosyltransferase family 2 protein [Candidatus Omnitrophota bacterium]
MGIPLSVLVTTFNQEANIASCLESVVGWAGQVWVLDSFSTDRTVEIVQRYPVSLKQRPFDDFSSNKNWALDQIPWAHEWVLILDADEVVPEELKREIQGVLQGKGNNRPGFYLNRRVFFLGRWLRHCGWYPNWNLRLFRHRLGRYEKRKVHEHLILQGQAGYLSHDLIHEDRRGLAEWIARHNQFSSLEAQERLAALLGKKGTGFHGNLFGGEVERKRFLKEKVFLRLPAKPLLWFLYLYVIRWGFLDGRAGFHFCLLQGIQEYQVSLKVEELRKREDEG